MPDLPQKILNALKFSIRDFQIVQVSRVLQRILGRILAQGIENITTGDYCDLTPSHYLLIPALVREDQAQDRRIQLPPYSSAQRRHQHGRARFKKFEKKPPTNP